MLIVRLVSHPLVRIPLAVVLAFGGRAYAQSPPAGDDATDQDQKGTTVDVVAPPRRASYAAAMQTSGTRDPMPLHDVPQSITVLDRALLDDVGARRTDDVLPLVPGVQLYDGYGGVFDDYLVRGFQVWAGTLYRNGYLNGYSGGSTTDAVNVERIEVIRGPASALYGPALPGGSIDFVTKRPRSKPSTRLGVSAGSFDTYRGELDATGPLAPHVRYRLTGAAETTASHRDHDTFRRWLANPSFELELAPGTVLFVEGQGYQTEFRSDPLGVPSIGGDPFALPSSRSYADPGLPLSRARGLLGRVELEQRLSERVSLRIGTQTKGGDYAERTLLWDAPGADGRTLQRSFFNWYSSSADTSLQAALHGAADTGPLAHAFIVGADGSFEHVHFRAAMSDPAETAPIDLYTPVYGVPLPRAPLPGGPANAWSYRTAGVYANDVVTIAKPLKVMVGGRLDDYSQRSEVGGAHDQTGQSAFSPRSGAVLDVAGPLSLYGNVSKGFWPSLGVDASGGVLEPQHSFSYEGGARVAADDDAATLDVALFHIDNRNIAVPDPSNPSFSRQIGEATSRGLEAQATARPGDLVRLFASYAFTDAKVTADLDPANVGKQLPLAARHAAALWSQLELPVRAGERLGLGVGGVYRGERPLEDETSVPAYLRIDAILSYRTAHLRSALRVENLLDARYVRGGLRADAVLLGAPRNVMLTTELLL